MVPEQLQGPHSASLSSGCPHSEYTYLQGTVSVQNSACQITQPSLLTRREMGLPDRAAFYFNVSSDPQTYFSLGSLAHLACCCYLTLRTQMHYEEVVNSSPTHKSLTCESSHGSGTFLKPKPANPFSQMMFRSTNSGNRVFRSHFNWLWCCLQTLLINFFS